MGLTEGEEVAWKDLRDLATALRYYFSQNSKQWSSVTVLYTVLLHQAR